MKGYKCKRLTPAIRSCLKNVWIGLHNPGEQKTLNWCVRHKLLRFDKLTHTYKLNGRGHDVAEHGTFWIRKNEEFKAPF